MRNEVLQLILKLIGQLCTYIVQTPIEIAFWLATEPLDMRAGSETALARVVQVFGAEQPHFA